MITLDEVIKAFEECIVPKNVFCNGCYKVDRCKITEVALNYLKEYQRDKHIFAYDIARRNLEVAERNDPLTWDELKTMEGKPVWTVESTVTYDDNGIERIGRWNIIREVTQEHIIFYIGLPYHKSWQGIGWQAYRKERE